GTRPPGNGGHMTAVELLKEAREVIADKRHFTTGTWARDAKGEPVSPHDPKATQWDGDGAIRKVIGATYDYVRRCDALQLVRTITPRPISCIGDEDGHDAVLAVLDRAAHRN